MRLIKMFLFVLLGLFGVVTIIGLFIPSSVKISRGIIVNADSTTMYRELSDVKNWNQWLPWITADSGAIVQLSAVTNQPGSFFRWQGVKYNSAGTITIKEINPDEILLLHELKDMNDAKGGFRVRSTGAKGEVTEVLWYMEYKLRWYPWERFYGIFVDHIIGPAFEKGLEQLKNYAEQQDTDNTTAFITTGN
ncbi:SRPBCC family protein [Lacibacter sp. H407]|uniref:SRPBCC family protein n=1 Tax=Lacibacter sp. H407 TaxID=3133423 RepID=UPI0030C5669A